MGRPRKLWRESVGGYGHSVTVLERRAGGTLSLRWWDASRGCEQMLALGHNDREAALVRAREHSAQLLATTTAAKRGVVTVLELLARYEHDVSRFKKGAQPREDARRIKLWQSVLGAMRDVRAIDHPTLDKFVRDRRAGRLRVPGVKLSKSPSARSIDADIVFLHSVLNWGTRVLNPDGTRLVAENPIRGYEGPKSHNQKQPVASYDRYLALRAHADAVDPQGLFGAFLDLVEALGWRVTAVCNLRASDVDRRALEEAPHGRLLKRAEVDKENMEAWVPLSPEARAALDHALGVSKVLGDRFLFAAPKARHGTKPWSRWHARDLLERAETAAGLDHLDGGAWHPWRRKWASERKQHPARDVATLGGWRDLRSLERSYQKADPHTMLLVATTTTKLREAL